MSRRRHSVRVERRVQSTGSRSSSGSIAFTWLTFADALPAEIRTLTGRELEAAQKIHAEITTEISLRWYPGIDATMRVVNDHDGGRTYQILAVVPDATLRRNLVLRCSSGVVKGN